jgi:hypothetical protein
MPMSAAVARRTVTAPLGAWTSRNEPIVCTPLVHHCVAIRDSALGHHRSRTASAVVRLAPAFSCDLPGHHGTGCVCRSPDRQGSGVQDRTEACLGPGSGAVRCLRGPCRVTYLGGSQCWLRRRGGDLRRHAALFLCEHHRPGAHDRTGTRRGDDHCVGRWATPRATGPCSAGVSQPACACHERASGTPPRVVADSTARRTESSTARVARAPTVRPS